VTDKSQYSQDGDYIMRISKDHRIKKISVLYKNPKNGKICSKSVPKKMWERVDVYEIKFLHNFGGLVHFNPYQLK
jgi:hypothetical protein